MVTDGNYVGKVYFILARVGGILSMITNPAVLGVILAGILGYFLYTRKYDAAAS